MDVVYYCLILHTGKLRPREIEQRPQILVVNPMCPSLDLLHNHLVWKVGSYLQFECCS